MDDPFASADDLFPVTAPWAPAAAWAARRPNDDRLMGWLTTAGSLTRALRTACPGRFDLKVLRRTERACASGSRKTEKSTKASAKKAV